MLGAGGGEQGSCVRDAGSMLMLAARLTTALDPAALHTSNWSRRYLFCYVDLTQFSKREKEGNSDTYECNDGRILKACRAREASHNTVSFHLHEILRGVKIVETGSRTVVTRDFEKMETFWRWMVRAAHNVTVIKATQLCPLKDN